MSYPPSKTTPWKHQEDALNSAKNYSGYYLAISMGCGKSKVAIDLCTLYDVKKILILCPKSVINVWPDQFEKHSSQQYEIYAPGNNANTVKKKADDIDRLIQKSNNHKTKIVVILNYEAFWREPLGSSYDKNNKLLSRGVLSSTTWDMLILDEAARIKSPSGKASWGAARLAKNATHTLALSGTPFPHSILDIYAQFRTIDPNIYGTSFLRFRHQYCIMGGFNNKQVIKFINMDELTKKFYSRAFRVEKDDVLDLPDVMHETRYCELDSQSFKIYKELEEQFIAEIDSGKITVSNALVKLLRLSQLTSGLIKLDDGKEVIINNSKLDVVQDILEDLPQEEAVVIFCRFTNELQRAKEVAKKLGRTVSELSGKINQLQEWQNGKTNTLCVQIRSGGVGIDLTRSRYCIYISTGFSLGDYEQSLARMDRPGQTKKVTYYHIIAKKTVDEKIFKSLKNKADVISYVLKEIKNN